MRFAAPLIPATLKRRYKRFLADVVMPDGDEITVHVEARGLNPGRPYWYRFTSGSEESAIGRAVTAPVFGAKLDKLRFAFASCQHYEQGYYTAYREMLSDHPDLVRQRVSVDTL